ncbi:MAG: hypothetical protein ACLRZ9_09135 [Eubacterium sp.]
MKCPSCGAEIQGKVCEFCGTQITSAMQKEQEQLNKNGCTKCGSTNITFKRENFGEVRGKNNKKVIHRTVGVCKDCGNTWYADTSTIQEPQERKTWLWVLGWICIFPLPLTILLLRKKDMKPALKYGIIVAAWLIYIIIGLFGNSNNASTSVDRNTEAIVTQRIVSITSDTAKIEFYK